MKGFRRGSGPLVSILIPTRGRPASLEQTVLSLANRVKDRSAIEILFKIDEDDVPTIEYVNQLIRSQIVAVGAFVSPRGRGYWDLHLWLHQLCTLARGDWLFLLADDATMETDGWDAYLASASAPDDYPALADDIWMYVPPVWERLGSVEFVLVRRTVWKVLGHLSLSPHADTWLWSIMVMLGRVSYFPVRVIHHKDKLRDATAEERDKICAQSAVEIHSEYMIRKRMDDVHTLLAYCVKCASVR